MDSTKQLLADVNLARMSLSDDGLSVTLEFCNMFDGGPWGRLIASRLAVSNYHNAFGPTDDGLAAYLGELTVEKAPGWEAESTRARLGYGFHGPDSNPFFGKQSYWIHAEGGEIELNIVCGDYRFELS
jgi:hypothetical protein